MIDRFGRNIDYLRISVTDKCNLRCRYCMPDSVPNIPMAELLTFEEIASVVKIGAELGITKIKLTGGEPLVRRGIESLVGQLKSIDGIASVTMTSNGILLAEKAEALKAAGLDAINVSLDTLDADEFERVAGRPGLDKVLAGIDAALNAGIPVKINTVNRPEITAETVLALAEYFKAEPIDLRFIEMMPIGAGKGEGTTDNGRIRDILNRAYGEPVEDSSVHGNGPAVYVRYPGMTGAVGFISAVHGKFCADCNRVRMSAVGELKACLCYQSAASIREPLRAGDMDAVKRILTETIYNKPAEHCFEDPDLITERKNMTAIGG